MLSEYVRDHAFTIGWFGLMAFVWFGWGQEEPPRSWRWKLGVGSGLGLVLAGIFGYAVVQHWNDGSALEGRYQWFGLVVGAEVLAAGIGCLVLWRRHLTRWMALWVGLVVAVHFIPLAFFLDDWSLIGLALIQVIALIALITPLRRRTDEVSSRLVGPAMGRSLLIFACVSVVYFILAHGPPW